VEPSLSQEQLQNQFHSPDFIVKESKCGLGLFAQRLFLKNELVLRLDGPIILGSSPEWVEKYSRDYPKESRLIQIGWDEFLEPIGYWQDWLNHSCQSNCAFHVVTAPSGPVGYLTALENIPSGAEILFDYSLGMVNEPWVMENCQCGTGVCRGTIRQFTDLPKVVAERYLELKAVPRYVMEEWEKKQREEQRKDRT
jgi:SET domain-containing protein